MLAGVEADEMPSGKRRATAPTRKLALPSHDIALEADEPARANPDASVRALDDAALCGRIEDSSNNVWVARDGFEPVHRLGEGESVVIEVCEETHAEFDGIAHGGRRSRMRKRRAKRDRNRLLAHATGPGVSRARRRLIGVAAVITAVALAALTISPAALLDRIAALRSQPFVFALVVAGLYLARPLVAWPMSLCSAVVGYGYGFWGLPLALAGVLVTCLLPYLFGRYAGDADALGRIGHAGERFFARTGGSRGVAAARLAPLPADPVSVGAGLSGVSPREYLLGTLVGEVPWTVAAVLAGSSLSTLAVAGLRGAGVELALAAGALAVLALAGPAYGYLRERRAHQNVSEQS